MTTFLLPDFKINKDKQEDDIKSLLKIIKPSWETETTELKAISGGYLNALFRCFPKDNSDDAVTIRIRLATEKMSQFDNEFETKIIQKLSTIGHFPTIYAIFKNGYCYHYVKGHPIMEAKQMTGNIDDAMIAATAKELAYIHTIKLDHTNYNEDQLLKKIKNVVSSNQIEHKLIPNADVLPKEVDFMSNFLRELHSPIVTCHGDTHLGNVVWNKDEGKATFVDWEMSHVGYQMFDVAYFLSLMNSFALASKNKYTDMVLLLPQNYEDNFQNIYYEEWCRLMNTAVQENNLLIFKNTVSKFMLGVQLQKLMYAIIFPDVIQDYAGFDVNTFLDINIKTYLENKAKVVGIGKFHALL